MAHRILTPEEATAIQTQLNEKARAQLVVDGHFGTLSQQALMRFQAEHNIEPADGNPSQPTLDALGIPNLFVPLPKLTPNPVVQAIGKFALQYAFNQLTKGLPMSNVLLGAGTYVTGFIMIVVGLGSLADVAMHLGPIAGFTPLDPSAAWTSLSTGFAAVFLRRAIANTAK